jgi:hypothetical protein
MLLIAGAILVAIIVYAVIECKNWSDGNDF